MHQTKIHTKSFTGIAAVGYVIVLPLLGQVLLVSFNRIPLSSGTSFNAREEMFTFGMPSKSNTTPHFAVPQAQTTVPTTISQT